MLRKELSTSLMKVKLCFEDGTTTRDDVVVGADGVSTASKLLATQPWERE